jgi:hypothetical protein
VILAVNVKCFVFFCNLVNILHAGPAAATKVKIEIRGYLPLGKVTALMAQENCCLLVDFYGVFVTAFLSGK